MRKKWGIRLKAFILLLDEILIAGGVIFVLWKLGVPIPSWVYIMAGVACGAAYWLLYGIVLDNGKKSPVSHGGMIGLTGKSITLLNPEGWVRVQGEIWKAVSKYGVVAEGAEVLIEDLQGLTLIVKAHHKFE